MKRKIVIHRTKHDGTPRTKGPEIQDETEFQDLIRLIESGEIDADRIRVHLKQGGPSMKSPDPFARQALKATIPVSLYRKLKAKCKADGVSLETVIEDLLTRYVSGVLPSGTKSEGKISDN